MIKMRVTKVLREYAEKEVNKKKREKIDELWAEHKARRENMEAALDEVRKKADALALEILTEFGYHSLQGSGRYGRPATEIFDYYITNWAHESSEELRKKENEIRTEYDKKLEMFILETELGGDKDTFFKALAEL
jgi:hypothetical protein